MPGTTRKLGRSEVAAVIDARYAAEPDGWRKRRLLAVKAAAMGQFTSAEVGPVKVNQGIEDQGDVNEGSEHHVELLEA